jgi:hypothetical protein
MFWPVATCKFAIVRFCMALICSILYKTPDLVHLIVQPSAPCSLVKAAKPSTSIIQSHIVYTHMQ